ncbi:MAG: hypothetical protein ABIR06_22720, partial [Cyclobacteriaceae bacterium]
MIRLKILICVFFIACLHTNSQAQSVKITPSVTLNYFQAGDELPYVITTVRKRIDRRFYPISGLHVNLTFNKETENALVGSGITNEKGEFKLVLPEKLKASWESLDEFDFYATVLESDSTEEVSESLHISRARLVLTTDDESKLITGRIEQKTAEGWVPVEEVEMKFIVKRLFGALSLGDDVYTTDGEGRAEVELDQPVPGDSLGAIIIGCIVEDHDEFGNLFAYTSKVLWGVPTVDDNTAFEKRTLWAPRDRA